MTPALAATFAFYSIFVYYQQLHARNYRGASEAFGLVLSLFALCATLAGLAFLIYFGWKLSWWGAAGLFVLGIVARVLWGLAQRLVPIEEAATLTSLLGFLALPVCGVILWTLAPR